MNGLVAQIGGRMAEESTSSRFRFTLFKKLGRFKEGIGSY